MATYIQGSNSASLSGPAATLKERKPSSDWTVRFVMQLSPFHFEISQGPIFVLGAHSLYLENDFCIEVTLLDLIRFVSVEICHYMCV